MVRWLVERGWVLVGAVAAVGCLETPTERTCADYPRDTPECADYWGDGGGGVGGGDDAGGGAGGQGGVGGQGGEGGQGGVGGEGGEGGVGGEGGQGGVGGQGGQGGVGGEGGQGGVGGEGDLGLPDDGVDGGADAGPLDGGFDLGPDADADVDAAMTECMPGTTRPCGIAVGTCMEGTQLCNALGEYDVACLGAVNPAPTDACDGADDDCDGTIDEGCDCSPGDVEPCGTDVGECAVGERSCMAGVFGDCVGAVAAVDEVCNTLDDDCDGASDEGLGVGEACTVGQGACTRNGVRVCVANAVNQPPVCSVQPGVGQAEQCNAIDDDCDGSTDEGLGPRLAPTQLTRAGTRDRRPALSGSGEFLAAAWIEDQSVHLGTLSGDAWEVGPVLLERYDSDNDVYGYGIALAEMPNNRHALAVSYCDVGGCGLELALMTGTQLIGGQTYFNADASEIVSVASNGPGAGVVWVEDARDGGGNTALGFGHVAEIGDRDPVSVVFDNGRRTQREPSMAWSGQRYGVAYISSERVDSAGQLMFRTVTTAGAAGAARVISPTLGAAAPALHWMPGNQRYLLTWQEPGLRSMAVKVAVLDVDGAITEGPLTAPSTGAATAPSIIPWSQAANTDRVVVGWAEAGVNNARLRMAWLLRDQRAWRFGEAVDIGPVESSIGWTLGTWSSEGAAAFVYGVDAAQVTVKLVTGAFGCATMR